MKWLLS